MIRPMNSDLSGDPEIEKASIVEVNPDPPERSGHPAMAIINRDRYLHG